MNENFREDKIMFKSKSLFIILLCLLLFPTGSALADYRPPIVWQAEYFDNPLLKGNPARAIREETIDHDWGYNAPSEGVPADHFSVRWNTQTFLERGDYTFSVTVDDGVQLWVDGNLIIDKWRVQSVRTFTASYWLDEGEHTIQTHPKERDDYHPKRPQERDGDYHKQPAPYHSESLVIDNRDAGFTWGGPRQHRNASEGGYKHSFYWTKNTSTQPVNYGKWSPDITQPGYYKVFAYIPGYHATTAQVRYRIMHDGGRHDKLISQNRYYDEWVSLGTYYFSGHAYGGEFIIAYDNTREAPYSAQIAFDAIKLVATQ